LKSRSGLGEVAAIAREREAGRGAGFKNEKKAGGVGGGDAGECHKPRADRLEWLARFWSEQVTVNIEVLRSVNG
jgi:hypothetical protein